MPAVSHSSGTCLLDMFEGMDVPFDEDDNPVLPTLYVGIGFRMPPEMTPEQTQRLEEIIARKARATSAGQRYRRIPEGPSEVEFFDAFAAILRANGFYDIHRTRETGEFGQRLHRQASQGWRQLGTGSRRRWGTSGSMAARG